MNTCKRKLDFFLQVFFLLERISITFVLHSMSFKIASIKKGTLQKNKLCTKVSVKGLIFCFNMTFAIEHVHTSC